MSDSVACSSTTTVALPDEPCHQSCFAYFRLTSWKVCQSLAITERFSPMSNHRKRFNYSAQEKVAILRAHLVKGVPVSEVCQKHGIRVTNFHNWQKILFEGAEELFVRKPNSANVRRQEAAAEKKVAALEAKLVQKNEVIAELLQEHVQLKKVNGGP